MRQWMRSSGSTNSSLSIRYQTTTRTNTNLLSIQDRKPSEIWIKLYEFCFKKKGLKFCHRQNSAILSKVHCINPHKSGDTYMRHWFSGCLWCRLFSAKPLPKPLLMRNLNQKKQHSLKFQSKRKNLPRQYIRKCCLRNVDHFVLTSVC